jgi:spore germination cell wall hydrolase CwlJ-like protein
MLTKIIFMVKLLASPVQVECMAEAIYFEARNQPVEGQLAVGNTIVNRAFTQNLDICATVHDCEFSYYCDGKPEIYCELEAYKDSKDIAKRSLLYFKATNYWYYHNYKVKPYWAVGRKPIANIGSHVFYDKY